jgi:hypothetical protein
VKMEGRGANLKDNISVIIIKFQRSDGLNGRWSFQRLDGFNGK